MEGIVFEIQKFALNDGPGIRTVVFLKGCRLKCRWCSNPESQSHQPQLAYNQDKCTSCKACMKVCPEEAITWQPGKFNLNYNQCLACGTCVKECGFGALKIYGWKTAVKPIIEEVIKDKKFFDKSGGGLTISGGEPMAQFNFAFELLSKAKESKLHICMETAGFAPLEQYKRIAPLVDIFLFDYKLTNEKKHIKYTTRSNKKILANFDYLYRQNKPIIMRCPIIPGINDNTRHFKGIVSMHKKYPALKGIELMPYHDWGSHKFEQLGMGPYKIKAETVELTQVNKWLDKLHAMGCEKIVKG